MTERTVWLGEFTHPPAAPNIAASPIPDLDSVDIQKVGSAYQVSFSWSPVVGATHYKVMLRHELDTPTPGAFNGAKNKPINLNTSSNASTYGPSGTPFFSSDLGLQTATSVTFTIGDGSTPIATINSSGPVLTAYIFAYQNGVRGPYPPACLYLKATV